jgi:Arm DNA-binding domain/Phage integrase family
MAQAITTDAAVRAATVRPGQSRSDFSVDGVPGLRLRVTERGVKTFRLESRKTGKVTLGTYPITSLSDARKAATILIAEADRAAVNGATGTKVLATQDRRTLAQILDAYADDVGHGLASWAETRKQIENRYSPDLRLAKLTETEMLAPVRRDRNVASKRACRYLSTVLRWSDAGHPIPNGKLDDLVPETPVDRVLTDAELQAVINSAPRLLPLWRDFTLALIYSMRRRQDIIGAHAEHIDRDAGIWHARIYKVRGKGHRTEPHPMSPQLAEIFITRGVESGAIFPIRNNFDRTLKRLHRLSGTSDWSWHDLRRTARTIMGREGVNPLIAEKCMSHAVKGVSRMSAVYDHYDYSDEMRDAYVRLADAVDRIAEA